MRKSNTIDLTQGSIMKKMIAFAVPIMLGNILQQLYNVADRVVVGQFAANGEVALAAVGATSSLINLILAMFNGLAVGINVLCANLLGAKKEKELRDNMHTSVLLAAICGLGVGLLGAVASKGILKLMDTPADVLEQATVYMRIYFIGVPALLVYNFGAGIMRAFGDTKRPMYILLVSGLVNVILNVVLVVVFKRGVDGVAIATAVSQLLSAIVVMKILFDQKDQYGLKARELKIHKKQLVAVVRIGIPSGFGSMAFSLSNVIMQSAANSFNSAAVIAGKTAAMDIAAIIYQVQAALYATCVSFSGQCYGAGLYKRIDKLVIKATLICEAAFAAMAVFCTIFPRQLISLFNSNPDVIDVGVLLLLLQIWGYLLYAPSEMFLGCLRGMKLAIMPSMLNMIAICVPRLIWIWFIFPLNRTVMMLYLCYPISWLISSTLQASYYYIYRKKMNRQLVSKE